MRLSEFLRTQAKFPLPQFIEPSNVSLECTDVSPSEVALLEEGWKASTSVHDPTMVPLLLQRLDNILDHKFGDTQLTDANMSTFEPCFSPSLENRARRTWQTTDGSEASIRVLLNRGVIDATDTIMSEIDFSGWGGFRVEQRPPGGTSRVDFVLDSHGAQVLLEADNIFIVQDIAAELERSRIDISWSLAVVPPLTQKLLRKFASYMGGFKAKWLILSSHKSWVVFCLHQDESGGQCYMSHSSVIQIADDSTIPTRPLLALLLSPTEGVPVALPAGLPVVTESSQESQESRTLSPNFDRAPKFNKMCTSMPPSDRVLRSDTTPTQKILLYGLHDLESPIMWAETHLDNTWCPKLSASAEDVIPLQMIKLLGAGSTGDVLEARNLLPDATVKSVATKFVKNDSSDAASGERLTNEYNTYAELEKVYHNNPKIDRITPRCLGFFKGPQSSGNPPLMFLLLDFLEGAVLSDRHWESAKLDIEEKYVLQVLPLAREMISSESKKKIYDLAVTLHRLGTIHRDFEPRNIVRHNGHFKVIDFSASELHNCPETEVS